MSRTAAAPVAQAVGHRRAALGRRRRPCGRLLEPAPQVGQLQGVSVAAARRRRRRARSDLGSLSAGVGAGTEVEGEAAHRLHRLCGTAAPLLGSSAGRRGGRPTRWGVPPSGRSGRAGPQEAFAAAAALA